MIECYVNRSSAGRRRCECKRKLFVAIHPILLLLLLLFIFRGGDGISFIYLCAHIVGVNYLSLRPLVSVLKKKKLFVLINSNLSIRFKCLTSRRERSLHTQFSFRPTMLKYSRNCFATI